MLQQVLPMCFTLEELGQKLHKRMYTLAVRLLRTVVRILQQ